MNIGIDANVLTIPYPCGVRNYAEMLIENLSVIDSENYYFLFCTKKIQIPKKKNFKLIILPTIPIFKRQVFLPFLVSKYKIDVFHYLEPNGSVFLRHNKIITTIHDLNLSFNYPLLSKLFFTRLYNEITRYFVFRNTKFFLSPTSAVQKELKFRLKSVTDKKILNVIPEGINPEFRQKHSFPENGKYFLGMGDFSPRKNTKKLIKSYAKLTENTRRKHNLVIICSTVESSKNHNRLFKQYGLESTAKTILQPDNKELAKIYSVALCFIYPSLYEGFGLPILEAMSSGCPVITSNYGATKEVAGGAALLVNPRSESDLLTCMKCIIKQKKLRNGLIKKGLKRAKAFSWRKTAKQTLKIYRII